MIINYSLRNKYCVSNQGLCTSLSGVGLSFTPINIEEEAAPHGWHGVRSQSHHSTHLREIEQPRGLVRNLAT